MIPASELWTPEERHAQEEDFRRVHGYDWPDCVVGDCDYKACVPHDRCFNHLNAEEQRKRLIECGAGVWIDE